MTSPADFIPFGDADKAPVAEKTKGFFTKPGLLKKVKALQREIERNTARGTHGFDDLRLLLIEEGEYRFEQRVKDYPVVVTISRECFRPARTPGDPSPAFIEYESWLTANVPFDQFIAFPDEAQGRYKDCIFNVYFKDARWAIYFKVACL